MNDEENKRPEVDDETTSVAFPGLDALSGKRLGEFRIIGEIGRGSMGIVFEAIQENLDRRVAIKVLPPSISLPERSIRRFLREAESVAKLQHDSIVQIYAIGKKDTLYYYAMQFIEGPSLDEILIEEHPLPYERVADLMRQMAEAIDYAHQHGIIHRDVKPGNILISAGYKVVITDFGLARQERGATLTESGALVGTPIYMSPEQVMGKKGAIGRATDIYSLGVTLYELLTGKPPFKGENTQEILNTILEEEPRQPRKVRSGVPWELDVIAMKAMEKEPHRRFATAGEMAADLKRYLDGEPILARPSGVMIKLIKKIRKHRVASALASTAFVLLLAFAVYAFSTMDLQSNLKKYDDLIRLGRLDLNNEGQADASTAIEHLTRATKLFPDRAEAHYLLGMAYKKDEDTDKALDEFTLCLERDEELSVARMERAKIRFNRKIFKGALEDLMEIRRLNPEDFTVAYECTVLLYNFYNESQDRRAATRAEILDAAIDCAVQGLKYGQSADMHCSLAMLYFEKAKISTTGRTRGGFIDLSLEEIGKATDLDKNNRKAFEIKKTIEESRKGSLTNLDFFNLYRLARKEGFDEKWVISQGSDLVDPVWKFLKDSFIPSFNNPENGASRPEGKEPDA